MNRLKTTTPSLTYQGHLLRILFTIFSIRLSCCSKTPFRCAAAMAARSSNQTTIGYLTIPSVALALPEPPPMSTHTANTLRTSLPELYTAPNRSVTALPSHYPRWPLDCVNTHKFLQKSFDNLRIPASSHRLAKLRLKGKAQ